MQKTFHKLVFTIICVTLMNGCASHYGAVTITTEPAGVEVINAEDDSVLGITPLTTIWKDSSRNRQYVALKLRKQGYEPEISHFWLNMRHTSKESAKKGAKVVRVELNKRQ